MWSGGGPCAGPMGPSVVAGLATVDALVGMAGPWSSWLLGPALCRGYWLLVELISEELAAWPGESLSWCCRTAEGGWVVAGLKPRFARADVDLPLGGVEATCDWLHGLG